MTKDKKQFLPNSKNITEWVKSPEGKKAIREAFEEGRQLIDNLKKKRGPTCNCCYCRSHRRIGGS